MSPSPLFRIRLREKYSAGFVVGILLLLSAVASYSEDIGEYLVSRANASLCQQNLRQLESAKEVWGTDGYFTQALSCPSGGIYHRNNWDTAATCSQHSHPELLRSICQRNRQQID